tara:strand:+ start:1295 stop:1519 length:225 start_codon:yes stop_codon:yes gene_type:complete
MYMYYHIINAIKLNAEIPSQSLDRRRFQNRGRAACNSNVSEPIKAVILIATLGEAVLVFGVGVGAALHVSVISK